jgi:inosine-uridine nucleoside N-ribohydrolase
MKWHHKGNPIPVYKGSRHPTTDLSTENAATQALYQPLKKEKLTILALGQMANIATLNPKQSRYYFAN